MSDEKPDEKPRTNLRVLRGRPPGPAPKGETPDRYYTTSKINSLVPIPPGWSVYVLWEHPPGELKAVGEPVVQRHDVAAWGNVTLSYVAVYGKEERPAGGHQYWQPLVAFAGAGLFMLDNCHLSDPDRIASYSDHFMTMALVGPNDEPPAWVGDSAAAMAAREDVFREVHEAFEPASE